MVNADLVVLRDLSIQARRYLNAVSRLRDDTADGKDIYISLVETINWLSAISKPAGLQGDVDVQAVDRLAPKIAKAVRVPTPASHR